MLVRGSRSRSLLRPPKRVLSIRKRMISRIKPSRGIRKDEKRLKRLGSSSGSTVYGTGVGVGVGVGRGFSSSRTVSSVGVGLVVRRFWTLGVFVVVVLVEVVVPVVLLVVAAAELPQALTLLTAK